MKNQKTPIFIKAGKILVGILMLTVFLAIRAEGGTLKVTVKEKETGLLTPSRVRIIGSDGEFYQPRNPLKGEKEFPVYFISSRDKADKENLFYTLGEFSLELPTGKTEILIEKGFEYTPFEEVVEVPPEGKILVEAELSRWIDMKKKGWYSGDCHVHFHRLKKETSENFLRIMEAEDINVVCSLAAQSEKGLKFIQFAYGENGAQHSGDHRLYSGQEFCNDDYGHYVFLNIKKLIGPVGTGKAHGGGNAEDYPSCYEVFTKVHNNGGIVIAAHSGWGETPVDLALGEIDAIEMLQSNKWNRMVKPCAQGIPHWYYALNCGFKIPGTAGSDYPCLTSKVPFAERTYVHLDGEYSFDKWIENLKRGYSFVTTGPVIEFSVEGKPPGETLDFARPGEKVRYSARVQSVNPLDGLEVVKNGIVIKRIENPGKSLELTITGITEINRSSWLAARAGGWHPIRARKQVLVHSNPVYVDIGGKPALVPEAAEWWLGWIDEMIAWIDREGTYATGAHKQEILDSFREGKYFYQELARGRRVKIERRRHYNVEREAASH